MEQHIKRGQFVVESDGISQVVEVDDSGKIYVTRQIMPKEIFVEAFQKFIKESEDK